MPAPYRSRSWQWFGARLGAYWGDPGASSINIMQVRINRSRMAGEPPLPNLLAYLKQLP